jgi:quercetin 2,3-dioxygenase
MSITESSQSTPSNKPSKLTTLSKALPLLIALIAVILAFPALRSQLPKVAKPFSSIFSTRAATMSTTTTAAAAPASALKITKRPWQERGHADHGWLYTFHTFSFAMYRAPKHSSFGPLRVINEDRVEKGTGFGTHSHADFLIWSYVVSGELEHRDSMGNLETLRRGDVQFTRAGSGISHSEYNRNDTTDNHFLQIWARPDKRGYEPLYITKTFSDEEKTDKLVRIVESRKRWGKETDSPIPLEADLSMDASILSPGKSVEHQLVQEGPRKVYLHVVMTDKTQPKEGGAAIKVGETVLGEGDGAYVEGATGPGSIKVESVGGKPAEFLLFDLGMDDA